MTFKDILIISNSIGCIYIYIVVLSIALIESTKESLIRTTPSGFTNHNLINAISYPDFNIHEISHNGGIQLCLH